MQGRQTVCVTLLNDTRPHLSSAAHAVHPVTGVFISVALNCCSQSLLSSYQLLPTVALSPHLSLAGVQTELSLISEHGSVFLLETHSCLGGVMM